MNTQVNHVYVVTHTDLDGIGSAAVYLRMARRRPGREATIAFTEPYELHNLLSDLSKYMESGDLLVVTDLGLNEDTRRPIAEIIADIVGKGVRVEWYDHHVWEEDDIKSLAKLGAAIHVDRSTCATGVVAKYAPAKWRVSLDEFTLELVDAVCSADLWRWNNSLSPKLFRAAGSREASNEWRLKILEKFLEGVIWDDELERKLEDYVNEELKNMTSILATVYVANSKGVKIAVAYKENGPPANSIVGALLLSRFKADIAVIMRPNGGLSLRSRRVNVQRIASKLGGGGHPRAAGARIELPLWVRILRVLTPKVMTYYGALVISRALSDGIEYLAEVNNSVY